MIRLFQAGIISSLIGSLILMVFYGAVFWVSLTIVNILFPNMGDLGVFLTIMFALIIASVLVHYYLVTSRPVLSIKAKFLKYSLSRSTVVAKFQMQNKKYIQLGFHNWNIIAALKRGDVVNLTYQGTQGISVEKILPSPPKTQINTSNVPQSSQPKPSVIKKSPTPPSRTPQTRHNSARK